MVADMHASAANEVRPVEVDHIGAKYKHCLVDVGGAMAGNSSLLDGG